MPELTPEGQRIVGDLAQRYGFGTDAVTVMLQAVAAGGGAMAQFNHPEFGGMGQWSRGGMTMIGDMFNNALKVRVDGLCSELAGVVGQYTKPGAFAPTQQQSQSQGGGAPAAMMGDVSLFVPQAGLTSRTWWPAELGQPSSVGQQNDIRYAVFPATRRLALVVNGVLSVYDTLDHQIGGVSQQQSGDASLSFTSQRGLVRLSELPVVADANAAKTPAAPPASANYPSTPAAPAAAPAADDQPGTPAAMAAPPPMAHQPAAPVPPSEEARVPPQPATPSETPAGSSDDIFAKLERLAGLRDKGILSEQEFAAKKGELLARL